MTVPEPGYNISVLWFRVARIRPGNKSQSSIEHAVDKTCRQCVLVYTARAWVNHPEN